MKKNKNETEQSKTTKTISAKDISAINENHFKM